MNFWKEKKILVTGGNGFFGKAVVKKLQNSGVSQNDILIPLYPKDDLLNFDKCLTLTNDIDIVIHLAAKVGGILYNQKYPGSMIFENLQMGLNIMEASRLNRVKKVINIGTTCGYPEYTPVPFKESDLWNGYPAKDTAPYGLAKKMLLELGRAYFDEYGLISNYLLPVNLYGPEDHFEGENTHVIPALISRIVNAKKNNIQQFIAWGSGKATREFLYIDDAAEGILLAAEKYDKPDALNLGTGAETSIKDLVLLLSSIVGYKGEIIWDSTKPDGTPRRSLDMQKTQQAINFNANTDLESGLRKTIEWYLSKYHIDLQ